MPNQVYLKVFANPHCAELDSEGRAFGRIQYEPSTEEGADNSTLPFVGCHVIATPKKKGKSAKPAAGTKFHHVVKTGVATHADEDHVWEYDTEPALVPQTPYYMDALQQHGHHGPALLPADLETYIAVHGTADRWRTPHERLHQYVSERGGIPQLTPNEDLLEASRDAHAAKHKAVKEPPVFDPAHDRDHAAEWEAFVGSELVEKHKAIQAAHLARVAPPKADDSTTTSATV